MPYGVVATRTVMVHKRADGVASGKKERRKAYKYLLLNFS
jgi:hypothetical protein